MYLHRVLSCFVLLQFLILLVIILVLSTIVALIGNTATETDLSCARRSCWTFTLQKCGWKLNCISKQLSYDWLCRILFHIAKQWYSRR